MVCATNEGVKPTELATERLFLRRFRAADCVPFARLNADPEVMRFFTPCVEITWRLAREAWGRGYASEGAREALRHAFQVLKLAEIVSFTVPAKQPSLRVMERLGMRREPAEDFDHPRVPEGHPLRRHVLYRLPRAAWAGCEKRVSEIETSGLDRLPDSTNFLPTSRD